MNSIGQAEDTEDLGDLCACIRKQATHSLADGQERARTGELRRLRKIYIPEIAIRLTRQLTKATRHSPR